LFFVIHAQLVGTLEPGHDFADVIDIDKKRAMGAPEDVGVEIFEELFERAAIRLAFHAHVAAGGDGDDAIFDGGVADVFGVGEE
jgi:hypothetical protein